MILAHVLNTRSKAPSHSSHRKVESTLAHISFAQPTPMPLLSYVSPPCTSLSSSIPLLL
jgi:hypothetical protein